MKKFKRGEKQLSVLELIQTGATYTDIIRHAYELSYGKGTYTSEKRGYWSGAFCNRISGAWVPRLTLKIGKLYYLNVEGKWASSGELSVVSAYELEKNITSRTLVCGELGTDEKKILARRWRSVQFADPPQNIRRPSILANIAYERFIVEDFDDAASTAPIYLRTVKNIDSALPV